ncbi:MAG TPA: hypothetical protein VFZ59_11450 [Verrucomicrobiae bacterium]|nr:hypothetical protein [Verrucomicrobiae bacterium]
MNSKSYERHGLLNSSNNSKLRPFNSPRWQRLYSVPPLSSGALETLFRLAVLGLILLSVALTAYACGPFFPNNLLGGGDQPLLAAPLVNFERELMRLKLVPGHFSHISQTNGYEQQTFDGELTDLKEALRKAKMPPEEVTPIIEGHRSNREKLKQYVEALNRWDSDSVMKLPGGKPTNPKPAIPQFDDVPGLPAEFAEYFAGALALRNPAVGVEEARNAWERLLARPATDRQYKSVWAAFMLGKSWEETDDAKAVEYFQRTRDLAKRGFADSIGLAAAALGREARAELRRRNFERAIALYLEQYAAGDSSAAQSLQVAAQGALEGDHDQLEALARTESARGIITAYLISSTAATSMDDDAALRPARAWLDVMESAGVNDVTSAEQLALMAYQRGEFAIAERWLKRAKGSPVGYWLQAKLCLRAGKVAPAAALLTRATSLLPVQSEGAPTKATEFADSLLAMRNRRWSENNSARQAILGELGVLRLSRGEFEQALDALLRSGFWEDAAYVAERVLTLDELKRYVDSNWPSVNPEASGTDTEVKTLSQKLNTDIRYLLARRLTRESRGKEAREYFPLEWQSRLDGLVSALNDGWNETLPAGQRAKSLFAAACVARTNGMELLGTELAPDWFVRGGDFDFGLTLRDRETNEPAMTVNVATDVELNRARQHGADPEVRFHYRYQAALLAWEAAKLLPDNSAETARVLCVGGTWLKTRDPETADLFYKSLVRRCRRTAIGEQADRMRWFPVLDESGNPKPYRSHRETLEMNQPAPETDLAE